MPSVFSMPIAPYGDDDRIELAPAVRGRRAMPTGAHATTYDQRMMNLPDYGCCKLKYGTRPFREIQIYLHAGYFTERRFASYCDKMSRHVLTRLQAHHSYVVICNEPLPHQPRSLQWRIVRSLRTGKISREMFCSILDMLELVESMRRNGQIV
jgi:hypothetical protein